MPSGAVLLAAGAGRRFGGKNPKQLASLNGEPLFVRSLKTFSRVSSIREIVVVAHPDHLSQIARIVFDLHLKPRFVVVPGGAFRGESVRNGVLAFSIIPEIILIHDTARPLVSEQIIRAVEKSTRRHGVALAAWPLGDTLKKSTSASLVQKTIPRKDLWLAQTPQGFKKKIALQCLLTPKEDATDDTELAERQGYKVALVKAAASNIKVTVPEDLRIVKAFTK